MACRPTPSLAIALLVVLSCKGDDAPPAPSPAALSAGAAATTASTASGDDSRWERSVPLAAWLAGLPEASTPLAAGESAWAALPLNEMGQARLGLVRIASVSATRVSVVDGMGHRYLKLPRSLVHRLGSMAELHEGDIALCARWTTASALCRVETMKDGRVLRAAYDWAGATRRGAVDHAEPLPGVLVALSFANYPLEGRRERAQVVALDAQHAWLLDESGHVSKRRRRQLRLVTIPRALKAGKTVHAYRWGAGYQRGQVVEVLEPQLRYRVALDGDRPSDDFFISHLSTAP